MHILCGCVCVTKWWMQKRKQINYDTNKTNFELIIRSLKMVISFYNGLDFSQISWNRFTINVTWMLSHCIPTYPTKKLLMEITQYSFQIFIRAMSAQWKKNPTHTINEREGARDRHNVWMHIIFKFIVWICYYRFARNLTIYICILSNCMRNNEKKATIKCRIPWHTTLSFCSYVICKRIKDALKYSTQHKTTILECPNLLFFGDFLLPKLSTSIKSGATKRIK